MAFGGMVSDLFGSDEAPKAVINRFAGPTVRAIGGLSSGLGDVGDLARHAFDTYMAGQGRQEGLADEQSGVLHSLLARRLGSSPDELLGRIGTKAFSFIDPNVVSPLAQFDVNYNALARRARGLNPAAVDSTADRLRSARIASGRYYDVARDVLGQLPTLYGQASNQALTNDAIASGIIPQVAGAYEAVSRRPVTGILDRIGTTGAATDAAGKGIRAIIDATQGYKQPKNWADRVGAAGERMESSVGNIAQMAGSALGGGGGGGL